MKLIIITQKVNINDDNLGFFHRWLEKLAEKVDGLYVVGLSVGEHHLPENTTVFSLGKEKGYSKFRQLLRLQKFLFKNLRSVDGVLIHMCPIYAIASFPLVKFFRKKFVVFYAHGGLHIKLKIAEKAVDTILTSSLVGCRLKSKKIRVIGQGIDVELFKPKEGQSSDNFRILYAGRINKTKDPRTIIKAIDILVNQKNIKNIKARIIGHPLIKPEREYLQNLKDLVRNSTLEDNVEFVDGVPYSQMPRYYQQTDLFVNPSSTGSLDKVVLEAMSSGCLILNCNVAYKEMLADKYLFNKGDEKELARKIVNLMKAKKDPSLRGVVVKNHNLDNFIEKIITQFHE